MITIFHNARCSKSREGLEILKKSGEAYEVREYLKEPVSEEELKEILEKLGIPPIKLIRTEEKIWKENFKGEEFSDDELVQIMVKHPKLIQRPIVVKNSKAVVGRPPSEINTLLDLD